MRLRTTESLIDEIDADLAWRKKELANLLFMASRFEYRPRPLGTILRAGIALLYAHWEGFLKNSAEFYLQFVANQKLTNSQLAANFLSLAARREIHDVLESNKMQAGLELVGFFRNAMAKEARFATAVQTKSNLSSEVLRNLAMTVGVDFSVYETKANLIDFSLVRRRNTIAHGEEMDIGLSDFRLLHQDVLDMLEFWRNQVQNAAVLRSFRT